MQGAEVVLPGAPLDETLRFFVDELGFRLRAIHPADQPTVAVVVGHGLTVRLDCAVARAPGAIRLLCADGPVRPDAVAPNGTHIAWVPAEPTLRVPDPVSGRVVSRAADGAWTTGRAGMRYRDLIPGRLGGHVIASHIRIDAGGPVPDMVHFHRVRCQVIFCHRGWVRVVYEDQGPPFELQPGDAVLQPPGIRHRVLACSAGLEVLEVTCPAVHETVVDEDGVLPTAEHRADRRFDGQRFVRHLAAGATWGAWSQTDFASCKSDVGDASGGVVQLERVRAAPGQAAARPSPPARADVSFCFVRQGHVNFSGTRLIAGDASTMSPGGAPLLSRPSADMELLVVRLGAQVALGM